MAQKIGVTPISSTIYHTCRQRTNDSCRCQEHQAAPGCEAFATLGVPAGTSVKHMMPLHSPNLLATAPPAPPSPPTHRNARRVLRACRTVAIVVGVMFLVLAWTTRSSNPNIVLALRDSVTVRSFLSLLRSPASSLDGERDGRIAVLLLGMGGAGHEGPLLADTILVASITPSGEHPTFISVPRDLLLPLPTGGFEKANAIHAYAEDRRGRGPTELAATLEDALGIRIPYYVRVDFRGFVELIDDIDGVDVDVERTVNDTLYPIAGNETAPWEERYEHLIIPAGQQHFDGALALKYVRSRGASGPEGSDFARARRQQRLLEAVREKIDTRGGLANPRQLAMLLENVREHVATNLALPELLRLTRIVSGVDPQHVTEVVFSDGPDGELEAGRALGAYVLRPRGGSFDSVRQRVRAALTSDGARAVSEQLTVDVWNGTMFTGLASTTAATLDPARYTVRAISNAPSRNVPQTIIYYEHRTTSDEPNDRVARIAHAAQELATQLHATTSTSFPAIGSLTAHPPDILIVLGASAQPQATSLKQHNDPRTDASL